MHEEREAVLGQMRLRDAPSAEKIAATIGTIVLAAGTIVGLGPLIVFH